MKRILSLVVAVALVLTLSAATAEAAGKKKKNQAPTGTVVGLITAVSEDGKTISVTSFGKNKKQAAPTEVKLSDKTKIDYIGIKDKAEQKLGIGFTVIVGLDDQDPTTASVIAAGKAPVQTKKKKKTAN